MHQPQDGGIRTVHCRIDEQEVGIHAGDPLEQLNGSVHVVEQSQAQHDVELVQCGEIQLEEVVVLEAVSRRIDVLGLEHEFGLLDVHPTSVDAQYEIAAGLDGIQ